MSSPEPRRPPPTILCAGIAVEDLVFRVPSFPAPGGKGIAEDFVATAAGCGVNAAVALARLGGRARFAGPLGDDAAADRILALLRQEGVADGGAVRMRGLATPVSGILIDASGERMIVTRRERGLSAARPSDPAAMVRDLDLLHADNHYPDFVLPLCEAAHRRGIPIVLDADGRTGADDPLFALASHTIFSAEALRAVTGIDDLTAALVRVADFCRGFLAVTDGTRGCLWRDGTAIAHLPAFEVKAVDTVGAGDVFHAGFALALAEGAGLFPALRFAAAAAARKCTRFGGAAGAPTRGEVEAMLAGQYEGAARMAGTSNPPH